MLDHHPKRCCMASRTAAAVVAAITFATQSGSAANDVFATFVNAGEIVSGAVILALDLPPGKYAILAKINVDQDDAVVYDRLVVVTCTLQPAKVIDRNVVRLHPSSVETFLQSDNATLPLQVVTELTSNTTITLSCTFPASESVKVSFRFAKMTAIRFEGELCERASPAICSDLGNDLSATFKKSGSISWGSPIVKLSVPSGKYVIFAKINLDNDDRLGRATLTCTLQAGTDLDRNVVDFQPSGVTFLDNAALPFQIVQELRTRFVDPVPPDPPLHDISLSCRKTAGASSLVSFRFAKIVAIKLDGNLCEEESVAVCP